MAKSALLVMDVQTSVVARLADGDRYLDRRLPAVEHARAQDIPVIHVVVQHRDGHPEVNPNNKAFGPLIGTSTLEESNPLSAVHARLHRRADEPVVVKRFFGAFSGTDLDSLLRAAGVDTLVLTGLATSGVVLSTVREASERQYRQLVLSDGCADLDDEVHRVLIEKVFPREADVVAVADWIGSTDS